MLKLLGAAAVFCAVSWCGLDRAGWYRRRLDCLRTWQSAILEGERMLCDLGMSTPDYLERLRELPLLLTMAEQCLIDLKREQRLGEGWTRAVSDALFPLNQDELEAISALGWVLGRYEAEEQRRTLEDTRKRLEAFTARAEEEKARLGRMWSVLGLTAGALAVVLLY